MANQRPPSCAAPRPILANSFRNELSNTSFLVAVTERCGTDKTGRHVGCEGKARISVPVRDEGADLGSGQTPSRRANRPRQ